ncbi:Glycosyltransferase-like protein [Nitrosococcus halophilus Nc 4]|uniref:Glycosyltransferase-like protein n=1 Tax=Nitrosococcus halophilus (strain Nc4) TaxID=472759 RepID=D5BVE7_NITHN|nr:glycosyltransferase [Nitrosococcus halophilus]ADE13575.1 Glycosyltransferase-like protein [Nitrosococcus halophilus Nc 4]
MPNYRNILVASYYFPPFAGISGMRATKFCKYLPKNGWRPTVLTVDPRYYRGKALSELPQEVERMEVRRIRFLKFPGSTLFVKLLYPLYVCYQAYRERRRFDVVYLCGSPFHPFVSTAFITRVLGIPSVLDFRDFWSLYDGYDSHVSSPRARSLSFRVERLIKQSIEWVGIRYATKVVFASRVLKEDYAATFPAYQHKFQTINNGYDPEDFAEVEPRKVTALPKTIVLAGKFLEYTPVAATLFLTVLREFPEACFLYVGAEHQEVAELAAQLNMSSQVTSLGFMHYNRVLDLIAGADYGLVTNGVIYGMGTKIFDYLALGKPSLCLVPKDSIIAHEFGSNPRVTICETPHTEERIRVSLRRLFDSKASAADAVVDGYSRADLTRKLAQVLQSAFADTDTETGQCLSR